MKRLLLVAALVLVCASAFGQVPDRDVLVAPTGTVFTAESVPAANLDGNNIYSVISLTTQDGNGSASQVIPGSQVAGTNSSPALAFDSDSNTLFVIWLHMANMMTSEILMSAYSDGAWQPPVSINSENYRVQFNLRMRATTAVSTLQADGSYADTPALILHLVWWEQTGDAEQARYAAVSIQKGTVAAVETHALTDLVAPAADGTVIPPAPRPAIATNGTELLRQPALLDNGTSDSVDVLFGDLATNSLHRIPVKAIADTRIRIPVGHAPDNPIALSEAANAWSGKLTVINSSRSDRLVMATYDSANVRYLTYGAGKWTDPRNIATDAKLTTDAAFAALARMANAN